jgi:hypothetical protein
MGEPASGHTNTHPPFEPGNQVAEKHGAHSKRRWRPLAERLAADAMQAAPWLTRPAFRWSVEAWATAEARARLVDDWLDAQATADMPGELDSDGEPRGAAALSVRLHARAESLRARLGIDPTAMARLLASFAVGVPGGDDVLAALRAEGARLVAAHDVALDAGASANGDRANANGDDEDDE